MASILFPDLDLTDEEENHIFKIYGGSLAFLPGTVRAREISIACQVGEYNASKKNGVRAIKFFEKCIELYSKNVDSILKELKEISPDLVETFSERMRHSYYCAIYGIANCCFHGIGVEVDYNKAYKYFKTVADEFDDADAQHMLAYMYSGGLGVERNEDLAAEYYEKAALQGNMFAQNTLGRIYEFKKKDIQQAIYWYKKAADQGDDLATENLMRVQGADISVDGSWEFPGTNIKAADVMPEIMEKMNTDAANGDFMAQCALAESYLFGSGVPLDKEKGVALMKKYADAGNPFAQYNLGAMYDRGEFVEKYPYLAFHYFKLAAKQGHVSAKYNVGGAYFSGIGVEDNVRKSFRWLFSAARDGHPDAQYRIGLYYNFEIGCRYSRYDMIHWMTKAAEQGHYYAQRNLINFCKMGVIDVNVEATLKKWTQALANNHEGNKGYSKPIMKLGEIPYINDYDPEDRIYKMPKEIIDEPIDWLGPLPEKYQKKSKDTNDDWFLDFVKKAGIRIIPDEVLENTFGIPSSLKSSPFNSNSTHKRNSSRKNRRKKKRK